MSEFDFLDERKKNISPEIRIFVSKSFDILERIHELMEEKGLTQKQLSERLNKSEAEVSKWINGSQNFTLKTLAKLETALGADIIGVPCKKNRLKWIKETSYPLYASYRQQAVSSAAKMLQTSFESLSTLLKDETRDEAGVNFGSISGIVTQITSKGLVKRIVRRFEELNTLNESEVVYNAKSKWSRIESLPIENVKDKKFENLGS